MQKKVLIIIILLFINFSPCFVLSQNMDKYISKGQTSNETEIINDKKLNDEDTLSIDNPDIEKRNLIIGLGVGSHSSNRNLNATNFSKGIIFEIYLKFNRSNEIHTVIAFNYWKAQIIKNNNSFKQITSETINSKGLKIGLEFSLFKIYTIIVSIEPSASIENITRVTSAVFSFESNLKLNIPLREDKIDLLSTVGYKKGGETLVLGGGAFNYSFFSYSLGIEIKI